jgi:predicted glycosyltransferase involved in capsule biosynthesis
LATLAKGDVFVFVDADTYVPFAQIKDGVEVARHFGWSLPYETYYSLTAESTERFLNNDDKSLDFEFEFPGPDPIDRPPAVGGCIIVTRDAFETVNGYDDGFVGWGFEDRAFAASLWTLVHSLMVRVPGYVYHLWHPAVRFEQPNLQRSRERWAAYQAAVGAPEKMRALVSRH